MGTLAITGDKLRQLRELCDEIEAANPTTNFFGKNIGPSVFLVGDQGVYFMGNHTPDGEKPKVIYFDGCDPEKDKFDLWWSLKQDTFGGDDGVEFFSVAMMKKALDRAKTQLIVKFTPDHIELLSK